MIFCTTVALYPQEITDKTEPGTSEPLIMYNAGISIVPLTYWDLRVASPSSIDPSKLKIEFDRTKSTAYEANFKIWYFSFGGLASVNSNIIGKIDTVLGYIGFSSISLKVSQSSMRGTGYWDGPIINDMRKEFKFNDKVLNYDLIYNGGEGDLGGLKSWYAGLSYTRLTMPMKVSVTVTPGGLPDDGNPAYDERFSINSFGLTLGFDMLKDKSRRSGLDGFLTTQDRFGIINDYSFSSKAISRVKALNPGYTLNKTSDRGFFPFYMAYVDNDTSVGLCWTFKVGGGWIIFAAGYDLIWGMMAGPSETSPDSGMTMSGDMIRFFRHGIIFRVYGAW